MGCDCVICGVYGEDCVICDVYGKYCVNIKLNLDITCYKSSNSGYEPLKRLK